jgi:hypothetical protein
MHNPHTLYLIGKEREADFIRQAEQRRQADQASKQAGPDLGVVLGIAARLTILVALVLAANIAS